MLNIWVCLILRVILHSYTQDEAQKFFHEAQKFFHEAQKFFHEAQKFFHEAQV